MGGAEMMKKCHEQKYTTKSFFIDDAKIISSCLCLTAHFYRQQFLFSHSVKEFF